MSALGLIVYLIVRVFELYHILVIRVAVFDLTLLSLLAIWSSLLFLSWFILSLIFALGINLRILCIPLSFDRRQLLGIWSTGCITIDFRKSREIAYTVNCSCFSCVFKKLVRILLVLPRRREKENFLLWHWWYVVRSFWNLKFEIVHIILTINHKSPFSISVLCRLAYFEKWVSLLAVPKWLLLFLTKIGF